MQDCAAKKIDFIITKSISRFSRNTTDCLELVRKLQELDVPIYFEKENINTGSMESELFLTILSSMAEGESTSISENSKWSIKKRFQNGTFKLSYAPYGYRWDGRTLRIIPEQAEVVKRIFADVLSGKGTDAIAKALDDEGVPTKRGGKWTSTSVRGILSNEKYTGDVIFQKTYTDDSFNRHTNKGELDMYYVADHHEAIISKEDFEAAGLLITQRAAEKGIKRESQIYQQRYAFSGKIICNECGDTFRRRMHSSTYDKYVAWCCNTHLADKDKCSMLYLRDDDLKVAFVTVLNKLIYSHKLVLKPYAAALQNNLVIDPEQAEVVKRIYREYLEGYSMDKIAAGLEADGILTGAGKPRWHTSTINKILRNEKYIGDALLQKTYTTDFLNKTRVKNTGIVPQYYVEGNHEAIIPREIYMRVQEELVRRRVVKTSANGKKRSYSCNHCFSQIIICGDCGEMFRRIHWNNRGCKSIVWRCISKLEPTGLECHARTINELDLQGIVLTALNELLGDKSKYQKQLQQNIASVIRASAAITTDGIDEKLMELQQELVKKANNKEAYDEIADQIFALREKRQQASMDTVQRDEQLQRITELQDFIKDQPSDLTVFDEALVKRWLKQITIWDDHCTVELKSGLKVDVER